MPNLLPTPQCYQCGFDRDTSTLRLPRLFESPPPQFDIRVSSSSDIHVYRPQIEENIRAVEDNIAAHDEQIQAIEDYLERIRKSRRHATSILIDQRKLLSPFQLLPRDILLEIFGFFSAEGVELISELDDLHLFGEVCTSWRAATRSSPMLWNRISLSLYHIWHEPAEPGVIPTSTILMRLREAIRLSQEIPLKLHFHVPHENVGYSRQNMGYPLQRNAVQRIIEALSPHFYRVASLDLKVRSDDIIATTETLSLPFPVLHTLRIELQVNFGYMAAFDSQFPRQIFATSPKLKQVVLESGIYGDPSVSFEQLALPWEQLTHFEGIVEDARQASQILDLMPRAARLVLVLQSRGGHVDRDTPDPPSAPSLSVRSALRHLSLRIESSRDVTIGDVLNRIDASQLRSFHIQLADAESIWSLTQDNEVEDIIPFIERVDDGSLTSLGDIHLPIDTYKEFLPTKFASLTHLTLMVDSSRMAIVGHITVRAEEPSVLPCLTSLRLQDSCHEGVLALHADSMALLVSRTNRQTLAGTGVARLSSFVLDLEGDNDNSFTPLRETANALPMISRLRHLQRDGVEIVFTYDCNEYAHHWDKLIMRMNNPSQSSQDSDESESDSDSE